MDKAFANKSSKSTSAYIGKWISKTEKRCIPFNEIPVKSPDASPMDSCAFGLLKWDFGKLHPRTLNGRWKMTQEEWDKIDTNVLRKSWKIGARAIVENHGYQTAANDRKNTTFICKNSIQKSFP